MAWAKEHGHARFHLASSGLRSVPLSALPLKLNELEITGHTFNGFPPLVAALAQKEQVEPGMIFTTLGTSLANHLAMASILEPGDDILVEQPTYELLLTTASYLGANVIPFPRSLERGYQPDPDEVNRTITARTKLIMLTNLHNPSSALLDEKVLRGIGDIAARRGAKVLVDEVYLDAAFDRETGCAARLGEHFLTTNSLTKVYGLSGLRCGWVVAQPDLVRRMYRLNDLFEVNPPHITEQISVVAMRELGRLRASSRSILERNQKSLREFLARQDAFDPFLPGFGTVVFARFLCGDADRFLEVLLNRFETTLAPGRFFGMPGYVRFGLGGEPEMVQEGLARIEEALTVFRG